MIINRYRYRYLLHFLSYNRYRYRLGFALNNRHRYGYRLGFARTIGIGISIGQSLPSTIGIGIGQNSTIGLSLLTGRQTHRKMSLAQLSPSLFQTFLPKAPWRISKMCTMVQSRESLINLQSVSNAHILYSPSDQAGVTSPSPHRNMLGKRKVGKI